MNAAVGLMREGCQVDIYALHGDGEVLEMRDSGLPPEVARLNRYAFELRHQPRRRAALAPFAAAKLFAHHGFKAKAAWTSHQFGEDGRNLIALHEAASFRSKGRYDILHVQFGTLAETVLNHREAGFLTGRVFVHFRGSDISSHLKERGPDIYRRVFERADGFFTNCAYFRDRLIALGAPPERTTIIPSAVNLALFSGQSPSWRPDETLRLLCVGRLVEKKGFAYAIDALALLAAQGVDFECRIIGDGPLRGALQSQIHALGLSSRVFLTGGAGQAEIAHALARTHIFLAPSTTASNGDQDASINTLKEAMAARRPFVSTLHGGIPELVGDADAGVLAPEGDARALYEALNTLLDRRADWTDMGMRGHARIRQAYSIEHAGAQTVHAYQVTRPIALAPEH